MTLLEDIIHTQSDSLQCNQAIISPYAILASIAHNETDFGARGYATLHEPAYCYGGRYYKASKELQHASIEWGCQAHSSYGPWQILYITAYEFGYRDDPMLLRVAKYSLPYVIEMLNRRVTDKTRPESFFDTWNSGTDRDTNVPTDYITKAMIHYRSICGA